MKKNLLIFKGLTLILVVNFCFIGISPAQNNSVIEDLQKVLDSSHFYDQNKRHNIKNLKTELAHLNPEHLAEKFHLYSQLFDQYKVFKSDSAYYYSLKTKDIALQLNNSSLLSKAYLNMSDIAISVGMYKEALDYLQNVNLANVSDIDKANYYGLYGRCYSDMAEYSGLSDFSEKYNEYARSYREKTVNLTEKGSFFNVFMIAYN